MTDSATHPCTDSSQPKKKAGRRVGSKGYSRNLTLAVPRTVPHRPVCCSLCGQATVYQLGESFGYCVATFASDLDMSGA